MHLARGQIILIGQRQYKTAQSSQNRVITVTESCEGRTTTAGKQIYLVHSDVTWPLAFRVLEGRETILFFFLLNLKLKGFCK